MQTHLHGMLAEGLDVAGDVHLLAIDVGIELIEDRVLDHRRGHGPEQAPAFAGVGLDRHGLAVEAGRHTLGLQPASVIALLDVGPP